MSAFPGSAMVLHRPTAAAELFSLRARRCDFGRRTDLAKLGGVTLRTRGVGTSTSRLNVH